MTSLIDNTQGALTGVAKSSSKLISIAIVAMGGQGGGVLTNWVVDVAESMGWAAQSTSVPGVAQRTGATIYYVEMMKPEGGKQPIFAQAPTPGDVDIVLAAEYIEAGRAILRGFITPDKTTLIASTHRAFSVAEKEVPGDGLANPEKVADATHISAKNEIVFDMEAMARKHGSVISSALFGALAGSEALPFPRKSFEDSIRKSGKGVEQSLDAFGAAYDRVKLNLVDQSQPVSAKNLPFPPSRVTNKKLDGLLQKLHREFPDGIKPFVYAGLKRVVDYQDAKYGDRYLDTLHELHELEKACGGENHHFLFSKEVAKYVALAMCYDDVIRVADLKTRASRFDRVANEVGVSKGQLLYFTEYMHPRMEEIAGILPVWLATFLEKRPKLYNWLDRRVNKGRRVQTKTVFWFYSLYFVAGLKGWRRGSKRHKIEMEHMINWLETAQRHLPSNYKYAVEIIKTRRLVKGYSDTHARGLSKFDRVLEASLLVNNRDDGSDWVRRLREAALSDEGGDALEGVIQTIQSFSNEKVSVK